MSFRPICQLASLLSQPDSLTKGATCPPTSPYQHLSHALLALRRCRPSGITCVQLTDRRGPGVDGRSARPAHATLLRAPLRQTHTHTRRHTRVDTHTQTHAHKQADSEIHAHGGQSPHGSSGRPTLMETQDGQRACAAYSLPSPFPPCPCRCPTVSVSVSVSGDIVVCVWLVRSVAVWTGHSLVHPLYVRGTQALHTTRCPSVRLACP